MYGLNISQKKNSKMHWHHFRMQNSNSKMMIQKLTLLSFITLLTFFTTAHAQYRHQAGVRLGSADQVVSTGFSYRYHFNNNKAIEGIVNLRDPISLGVLYEVFNPINSVQNLSWYYGGGAFVGFKGFDNFGIAGIAGIDYQFTEVPVNLSIDWKPELTLIESVRFRASTVAVSVRFSFLKK
jgi:hypothetical protein